MGRTAIEFDHPCQPVTYAFFSDLHLDSPNHDREALIADLEYARELNARILLGGDIFSVIMPLDRRSSGQHRQSMVDALMDKILDDGAKVLLPYADLIDMVAVGNHEVAALKYYYTDIVNRLRAKLQDKRDPSLPAIRHGGYTGFIVIRFRDQNNRIESDIIYFHHGKGGGTPVTRGVIDFNRMIVGARANIYWAQHKHVSSSDIPRVQEVDRKANVEYKSLIAFHTAGYESKCRVERYEDGYIHDWADESFQIPQGQGCAFIQYIPKISGRTGLTLTRVFSRRIM